MKLSEIKQAIEDEIQAGRIKITKGFVQSLSENLLDRCLRASRNKKIRWQEALFRTLYKSPQCETCGSNKCIFYDFKAGYARFCSKTCSNRSPVSKSKKDATLLSKFGGRSAMCDPAVKAKFKKTMKQRYGVEWAGLSKELNDKRDRTSLARYGSIYPNQSAEVRAKYKKTCLDKYGVPSTMMVKSVRRKAVKTTLARYGVENVSQNREVYNRMLNSRYGRKETVIKGKKFIYQGWEHLAIQHLVDRGIKVKNIDVEEVPTVRYRHEGKNRIYHPDFLVNCSFGDVLVEVKSTYTAGIRRAQDKDMFRVMKAKARACVKQGYTFRLIIVLSKKESVIVKDLESITRRTLKARIREATHRQA